MLQARQSTAAHNVLTQVQVQYIQVKYVQARMLMWQQECSPGANCWPEGPAAAAGAPAAAPELEAIAIMLCIISGDMLDIIELTLLIISGDTLMPAASRDSKY